MATLYWISASATPTAWATGANWSSGSAPANGDTAVFDGNGTASVTGATVATTGLTVYVDQSYVGSIGSISAGVPAALDISASHTLVIGRDPTGNSSGSPFIYITCSAGTQTTTIYKTASVGSVSGITPVVLQASTLVLNMSDGNVSCWPLAGTTGTATSIGIAQPSTNANPTLLVGLGATVTALTMSGGNCTSLSGNTTASAILSDQATYTYLGAGTHTAVTIGIGCSMIDIGSGGITTLNNQGVFDRTGDTRAITISTINAYGGASFLLDNGKASSTTRTTINLVNCGQANLTISTPIGEKF